MLLIDIYHLTCSSLLITSRTVVLRILGACVQKYEDVCIHLGSAIIEKHEHRILSSVYTYYMSCVMKLSTF